MVMAKFEKLLRAIKAGPKSVTITELIKLMELVGFNYRKGSKNHYVFYYQSKTVCVAPPHPGKYVKPVYINVILKMIEEILSERGDNNG
jgi:predicted RNA binding protein YcfA (HicA-like mRNA interferase family)